MMSAMTIPEFLLARIAEDRAIAERAGSFTPWDEAFQKDNYGHLTIQPTRVLAECEAKRRIVEEHRPDQTQSYCGCCWLDDLATWEPFPCPTLRALASVYADHPDYDPAWRAS